jgi:polysaccharide export outer membrane protein
MMPRPYRLFTHVIILFFSLLMGACNRNMLYTHHTPVKGNSSAEILPDSGQRGPEKILAPDDKLTLSIWGHDELSVGSIHTIYNVQEEFGKWLMLDPNGEVVLPQIGKVKLQGLTITQATKMIAEQYNKTIRDPEITLRLLNNQVTILGEVQKPGVYIFSSDNIRLVDLVGKAYGFGDYAKPSRIRIVRQTEVFEADLSNVAYNATMVMPGDVVYVPPAGRKGFDRLANKLIPLASLITAIALLYNVTND